MILIFVLFALFASTFVLGQAAVMVVRPIFLVMLRMALAAGIIGIYQLIKNPSSMVIKKRDWLLMINCGFLLQFVAYAIEFWVLQYVSGAKVALLWNLSPFITALFAYYLFHEKMTFRKIIGLVIGFLGFIPILIAQSPSEEGIHAWFALSWGEILIFVAVVASAYGWIVFKQLMNNGYQPLVINIYTMIIAALCSLITSCFFESPWNPVPVLSWPETLWYVFYLTIIGNVICFNLYGYLLHKYTTTYLSFCGFMTPLFAAIIQYFYLGIPVSNAFYLTLTIVSLGLYVFYREELRQGYIQD